MKVYLASWFASKDDIKVRAQELRAAGIEVTSRWLEEKINSNTQIHEVQDEYLRETARVDLHDILLADTMVLNVPSADELRNIDIPVASWARGGRHFEAGFHYATMVFWHYLPPHIINRGKRQLILVDHKENVFHFLDSMDINGWADNFPLPSILTFNTWNEAKNYLISEVCAVV